MNRRMMSAVVAVVSISAGLAGCGDRDIAVQDRPVRVVSDSGGIGAPAKDGDIVTVDYRAYLEDGSLVQEMEDFSFELGAGTVILGMDEGVRGMRQGATRVFDCPPHKHWGSQGYGEGENAIPPHARLTFHVTLKSVR